MAGNVLVFIDQFKGEAQPASWEALSVGRKLADEIGGGAAAMVFGEGVEGLAQTARHGRH